MTKSAVLFIALVACLILMAVLISMMTESSPTQSWRTVNEEVYDVISKRLDPAEVPDPEPLIVNINLATEAELDALPGIGPAKANAIIAYRTEHGPFQTIEQIMEVKGIGPKMFAKMKDRITIESK